VRLAAPEVGLELDDRVAPGAGEALERTDEECLEPVGEECALEELPRVSVLRRRLAAVHLS
jgi:hypothetical protein